MDDAAPMMRSAACNYVYQVLRCHMTAWLPPKSQRGEMIQCYVMDTLANFTQYIRYDESSADMLEASLATEDASPASGTSAFLRGRISPITNDPR